MSNLKPIHWQPKPGIGYSVFRRSDGGLTVSFQDLSPATVQDWYEFAAEHLLNADRLTRNLYDLRQVSEIPEAALQHAITLNTDPAARNIRLAVVVSSEQVRQRILEIAAAAAGTGADIRIFTDRTAAEAWLAEPLEELA